MKKVLVLGYFGYSSNQLDGQTVKTRDLYELFRSKKKDRFSAVDYFDTEIFKEDKTKVFSMLFKLTKYDILVYIPGRNNLAFFPIIFMVTKFANVQIHYAVVGGWLVEYLKGKPAVRKMLSSVRGIYPETESLRSSLTSEYGLTNVKTLHNFRISDYKGQINEVGQPIKIVFFARIHPLKGLQAIYDLANVVKEENLSALIHLYGPIHEPYKEEFSAQLKLIENISYKGPIQPSEIHQTLNKYDFMILPTKYYTEGFPGSILDAYISGIPVVVSKWKYASNFIINNKSGVVYEFDNDEAFIEVVKDLILNPEKIFKMKFYALEESRRYSQEAAWNILESYIK